MGLRNKGTEYIILFQLDSVIGHILHLNEHDIEKQKPDQFLHLMLPRYVHIQFLSTKPISVFLQVCVCIHTCMHK